MCMRIWEQSVCVVMFDPSCVIVVYVNLDYLYLHIFKIMLAYMLLTLIYRISLISPHADYQSNYARSNQGRELIKGAPYYFSRVYLLWSMRI